MIPEGQSPKGIVGSVTNHPPTKAHRPTHKSPFPNPKLTAILPQSRGFMSTNLPSFDKAQYALGPASSPDQCTLCQQPIAATYYRVNGNIACGPSATQAKPTNALSRLQPPA